MSHLQLSADLPVPQLVNTNENLRRVKRGPDMHGTLQRVKRGPDMPDTLQRVKRVGELEQNLQGTSKLERMKRVKKSMEAKFESELQMNNRQRRSVDKFQNPLLNRVKRVRRSSVRKSLGSALTLHRSKRLARALHTATRLQKTLRRMKRKGVSSLHRLKRKSHSASGLHILKRTPRALSMSTLQQMSSHNRMARVPSTLKRMKRVRNSLSYEQKHVLDKLEHKLKNARTALRQFKRNGPIKAPHHAQRTAHHVGGTEAFGARIKEKRQHLADRGFKMAYMKKRFHHDHKSKKRLNKTHKFHQFEMNDINNLNHKLNDPHSEKGIPKTLDDLTSNETMQNSSPDEENKMKKSKDKP